MILYTLLYHLQPMEANWKDVQSVGTLATQTSQLDRQLESKLDRTR
jgi:hypothetical protein